MAAATVLEAVITVSYEGLSNLVYRCFQVQSPITGSMRVIIRVWDKVAAIMHPGITSISPSSPLWFNPKLSHFGDIPDPVIWAGVGIKRVQDIVIGGK